MKRRVLCFALLVGHVCAVPARAPPVGARSANPLSAEVRQAAERAAEKLLKTAERMPADQYGFQVVPDIPTFAAELGHAIDMRMRTCTELTGSGNQLTASRMTAKADLVAAMKSSIAECGRAFAWITDDTVVQLSAGRTGPRSRLSSLYEMVARDSEVCGYLVLHLRLRGIEPPSGQVNHQ